MVKDYALLTLAGQPVPEHTLVHDLQSWLLSPPSRVNMSPRDFALSVKGARNLEKLYRLQTCDVGESVFAGWESFALKSIFILLFDLPMRCAEQLHFMADSDVSFKDTDLPFVVAARRLYAESRQMALFEADLLHVFITSSADRVADFRL